MKTGAFAAGTALAGAALFGAAPVPPVQAAASVTHVQDVVLAAAPTFEESLQNLLDAFGVGNFGQVFGLIPTGDGNPALTTSSDVSDLLAAMNPDGVTMGDIFGDLGLPLDEVVYSSDSGVDSLLGAGSIFQIGGTPIGDMELSDLLNALLGPDAADDSLNDLFQALGLGQYSGLIDALGLDNYNVPGFLGIGHGTLTANSSLIDWLSGVLEHQTSDTTLGGYLGDLDFGNGNVADQDLQSLLGIDPSQTWDQYLSDIPLGGSLLGPEGTPLGDESLGDVLGGFLPETSTLTVSDGTDITTYLDALGFGLGSI